MRSSGFRTGFELALRTSMFIRASDIICGVAAFCGLFGCMSDREFRRIQENPGVMVEQNEHAQRAETAADIERQNKKEAAKREKQLNNLIERQLHKQSDTYR
jgi:hypothetical protein